jgi:protein-disulfide isomerase
MKLVLKRVCAVLAVAASVGCVSRAEIEELKKGQQEILSKLSSIEQKGLRGGGGAAPQAPRGPDPAKVYAFPVGESAFKGAKDAWVTVVEVSDFQCPFCSRVTDTLKEIASTYGEDVRVVFKHNPLPFHNRALPAAMAAECAHEQGKFWAMHDEMFANQRLLEDSDLEGYAKKASLDVGRWKKCVSEQKYKGKIENDQTTASRLGARGTPAFFINGRFLSGAQPFASFKAIIDEELKKAKDSGLSKKGYYADAVETKGEKAM